MERFLKIHLGYLRGAGPAKSAGPVVAHNDPHVPDHATAIQVLIPWQMRAMISGTPPSLSIAAAVVLRSSRATLLKLRT